MATFEQIRKIRLIINEPSGVINIIAITENLPNDFEKQTAYLKDGKYYISDPENHTLKMQAELRISDEQISDLIDLYQTEKVIHECYLLMMSRIGDELVLKRIGAGAESTEYTSLQEKYNYYKNIITIWQNKEDSTLKTSTGRIGKIRNPRIAGGLI